MSLVQLVSLLVLVGLSSSAPVVLPTEEATVEASTLWSVPNGEIRKHLDLLHEFIRVYEEYEPSYTTTSDGLTIEITDNSMVPMIDVYEGINAGQALIHKLFAIVKSLEAKKQEYDALMATTTYAPPTTPARRGFFGRIFNGTPLRKLFD